MEKNNKPSKSPTVFLILSTMLLSLALFCCGIYSLYISIGFRFLNRSAVSGLNTATLYTYPNSSYGTGSGTMVGLILISIVMIGLGIGMAIIFFKQLPLYRQIKFIAKMPNVKHKEYSQQAKKSVIVFSIIGYIVCIAFSVFAIIVVYRSGVSANYLWIIAIAYFIVLGLSIASMVLMFVKISQLSKIKKTLLNNEEKETIKKQIEEKYVLVHKQKDEEKSEQDSQIQQPKEVKKEINMGVPQPAEPHVVQPTLTQETMPVINQATETTAPATEPDPKTTIAERLFTDGIFELSDQLVKLREIHVSGLISNEEYTLLREKWIDAVLAEPLFGRKRNKVLREIKQAKTQNKKAPTKLKSASAVVEELKENHLQAD